MTIIVELSYPENMNKFFQHLTDMVLNYKLESIKFEGQFREDDFVPEHYTDKFFQSVRSKLKSVTIKYCVLPRSLRFLDKSTKVKLVNYVKIIPHSIVQDYSHLHIKKLIHEGLSKNPVVVELIESHPEIKTLAFDKISRISSQFLGKSSIKKMVYGLSLDGYKHSQLDKLPESLESLKLPDLQIDDGFLQANTGYLPNLKYLYIYVNFEFNGEHSQKYLELGLNLAKFLSSLPKLSTLLFALVALSAVNAKQVNSALTQQIDNEGDLGCTFCTFLVNNIEKYVQQNATETEIINYLDQDCKIFGGLSSFCTSLVNQYAPTIIQYLVNDQNPATVCAELGLCGGSGSGSESSNSGSSNSGSSYSGSSYSGSSSFSGSGTGSGAAINF
eukprot:gene4815-6001_t